MRLNHRRRSAAVLVTAALAFGTLSAQPGSTPPMAYAAPVTATAATDVAVNVLVFRGEPDDQLDPVERATDAIAGLGQANGMTVHVSSDPAVFTPTKLAMYRAVVFLSAQGIALSREQETALQNYIKAGNGYLGIGDASKFQPDSDWFTGLIGARPVGALLPPPRPVSAVTASAENPPNETKEKLTDANPNTKWLAFAPTGWVAMQLAEPAAVTRYSLTSANDSAGRDPKNWTLQGSNDGSTWTDLDTRSNEVFAERLQRRVFEVANTTVYAHYRLNITANSGDPLVQLADLLFYTGDSSPPPEPTPQRAVVNLLDRQHPANAGLPLNLTRTDKWRNWATTPVGTVHTVAQVEERHYNPGPGANGPFHPISWCRDYGGGRSFYTGMGGTDGSYGESAFRKHLLGALKWTTGMVRADCQATIAANYTVERLTLPNQAGQLDQIGEPHGMTIAPNGKIFYVGKAACPSGPVVEWENPNVGLGCGTIHQWDPVTKKAKLLATLPVMGNRGSGDELVKNEEGLLGIVLDPKFAVNGWFYVYWMPHDTVDRVRHTGKRTISRLTYNATSQTVDLAGRKDLLQWEVQQHSCCHAGGGMAFDSLGNLYVGSGDSNSSGGSSGYSGNNWTQEFGGLSFQDARRTSGNTNDLNGKIIRIHPEPDGTYTIPAGNLFAPGTAPVSSGLARPEIYVMGVRNISRLAIDPETDWLTAAWVGPDAGSPDPELGPAKYETATIITEAGNHGWPYCMGNRQPYRNRSNTDASVLTGWYDCDNPLNTSPRNTGLVELPPVKDNMIWYSPGGGGPVFPKRPGSSIPTYKDEDAVYTQPYFRGGGGQAVMSGPTYHYDRVNSTSGVAWPKYWDDKWFIGDNSTPSRRNAVTVDPAGVPTAQPPAFGETFQHIVPGGNGSNQVQSWMDARFGPDGALYVLDYGGGFFTLHPNQKLVKVSYKGGPPTPLPKASGVAVQNKPLTYAFNGTKAGGVSYAWTFGDGTTSTEANPRHTYSSPGLRTAKLTVTYADGTTAVATTAINAGCVLPDQGAQVSIGDTATTVPNRNAGGGCRADDLIDDESTWATHALFVSHVQLATRQLRERGIITVAERDNLIAVARASAIGRPGVTGYEPLFDGTAESFYDWAQAPSGEFAVQPDGSLKPSGGLGMLWFAKKPYGDFSLKLQFRDVAPDAVRANSGVFVRFPDPRTPLDQRPLGSCGTVGSARTSQAWVAIYCGHEVQLYDGEPGEPQKTGSIYNFDPIGLAAARPTPKAQWNEYEIKVVGQHYTIIRNGVVINEFDNTPGLQSSRPSDPSTDLRQFVEGYIGLQNHGNSDLMEFRNIRLRTL